MVLTAHMKNAFYTLFAVLYFETSVVNEANTMFNYSLTAFFYQSTKS